MASISKVGTPSIATAVPPTSNSLSGLKAGEAIAAGDACYINSADGLCYRSNGTAATAAAVVDGFAATDAPINEAVSLYWSVNFYYSTGLTPGSFVYLDTVPGGLNTAPTTGGTSVIGRVIPDITPNAGGSVTGSRIWLKKSY